MTRSKTAKNQNTSVHIMYVEKVKTTKHKPSLTAWFFYFYIPKTS
ncbi:hypothetical protein B8T99_13185 [Vibrio cholerae]|nr:hypothetical protein UN67_11135 [Vibrio cholerae O1 biovar El Tor]KJJ52443.1 hypothetical protein VC78_04660 [Vibrio cholerae]OFJ39348.1 hypothetical protein BFX33_07145 [Vibrio cholerae V52]OWH60194.1 hypothetical protein CBG28_14325 [Vibrio cholerae O139]KOY98917.1 hypothetical protein AM627_06760 [Vibrio cholerae O1 biovar El Tor]